MTKQRNMALTKTVSVEITVDKLQINFASGAVTVGGTVKGSLIGKSYETTLAPSQDLTDWAAKVQQQVTKRMDESGALWTA